MNNIILFRIEKVEENIFSGACELIEAIETDKHDYRVRELLKESRFSKVRFVQTDNTMETVRDIAYSGGKKENFLCNQIDELERLISNRDNISYVFIFNKKNFIGNDLKFLKYFFLIKQTYRNCTMIIDDSCGRDDDYYKISHFLYFETLKDVNAVLYKKNGQSLQTLQLNGIGALKFFIPLIEINFDMYNMLATRISELWDENGKLHIIDNKYVNKVFLKIWQSCMFFMGREDVDNTIYFEEIDKYKGLSLIAFYILQLYKFHNLRGDVLIDDIALRFFVLEVTDGILQLVENVCLHNAKGRGYLSIYINKEDNSLEIDVNDYINSNLKLKNKSVLNYKFIKNLNKNDELKKYFELAELKDFFNPEFTKENSYSTKKFYGNYWDAYYKRAENAAFHYGLQVFASVINGYSGTFCVRSGFTFLTQNNQFFPFGKDVQGLIKEVNRDKKYCFPGTHYITKFPMNIKGVQKNIGFNSKISDQTFKDILKYSVGTLEDSYFYDLFRRLSLKRERKQSEKENKIKNIKEYIKSINNTYFKNDKYFITRIPFQNMISGQMMEYFCKALFLYIKELKDIKLKIAITSCSEECMLEFVRWFLIFYDKYNNCEEMKDVEIYLVGTDSREDFLLSGSSLAISQGRVEKVCMSKGVFNQRQGIISQAVWRTVEDNKTFVDEQYEIIPYDVIVEYTEGEKIFENAVLRTLDTNLQSQEFGCKVENCHVRIGSKIHITDNFYEAHSLFHSNYYTSRFAFLLAENLCNNLKIEKTEDVYNKIKKNQIILVGYETYSELLLCEIKKILRFSFGFIRVDHIIFDTANGDQFRLWSNRCDDAFFINIVPINSTLSTHNKIISLYKKYNMDENNILANYAIILIRDKEYLKDGQRKRIEVGNCEGKAVANNISYLEKKFWDYVDVDNKKVYTSLVRQEVDYMILIENNWNSPLKCESCYPSEVGKETPLIETNKASVVPTFMIGMKEREISLTPQTLIEKYETYLNDSRLGIEIVDDSVLRYAHIFRNGNDYRFYINSENLYKKIETNKKADVDSWCKSVQVILKNKVPRLYLQNMLNAFLMNKRPGTAFYLFNNYLREINELSDELEVVDVLERLDSIEKNIKDSKIDKKTLYYDAIARMRDKINNIPQNNSIQTYDIIVSPVHHSNATWIDQVTETIFENMPAILHFDVQKEFRDNMKTKYSNLTTLYENLCAAGRSFEINFHFVDDTIISGKTFNRAKTLIQSLFPLKAFTNNNEVIQKVNLFKSVILLFNRLSASSKLLYVEQGMFFSYINIYVPNLRNHEDACIMCKLVSDMNKIRRRSATNLCAEYFERKEIKHLRLNEMQYINYLRDNNNEKDEDTIKLEKDKREEKNFKRLYCNHKIFERISELGNERNDTDKLRFEMLQLIGEKIKKQGISSEEKMEWVISYFKVYSRPVVTFRKSFLEAYFGIAINFMESIQNENREDSDLDDLLNFYDHFVLSKNTNKSMLMDSLVKAILGGLGKVKSNYIIRLEQIIKVFEWYGKNVASPRSEMYNDFEKWYVYNIKRLVELSGDETKCLWIEKMLLEGCEWENTEKNIKFETRFGIQTLFGTNLYIENTRLIYDAVSDLNKNFYSDNNESVLRKQIENQLTCECNNLEHYYINNFFELVKLNRTFCKEQDEEFIDKCVNRICNMVKMYKHLNKKLNIQTNTQNACEITSIYEDYVKLLNYMRNAAEANSVFLFGADRQEDRLKLIKESIKNGCDENIPEDIKEVLKVDDTLRLKIYHIANSSEICKGDLTARRNNADFQHVLESAYINAQQLMENFESGCDGLFHIGKTIVIDFKNQCALVKIYNNWDVLGEECRKKSVNKVHVDPFYFYFAFNNSSEQKMIRGLRNILTFRDSLVKRIEEDFNNNLIQLAVASQKQAKDLSNDRAAGHTKMDEIMDFMQLFAEDNIDCDKHKIQSVIKYDYDKGNMSGNMLKLLADSYCSHKFRDYYLKSGQPLKTDDVAESYESVNDYKEEIKKYINVFRDCSFMRIDNTTKKRIISEIDFGLFDKDFQILCIEFDSVWILFIVLLIQNALKHGVSHDNKVFIKIYEEDKYIVVENDVVDSDNGIADTINRRLKRVPEGNAQGISLWVMDQCIRDTWRQYYCKIYGTEYDFENDVLNISMENIKPLIGKLQELEKCVICAEQVEGGDRLKIKLPIIHNKKD